MSNEEVPNEEGRANALKNKLQYLIGKLSYVLDRLSPLVRKRVEILMELQCEHDELEAQFFEERAVLETKYQELYQPLYTKRYEVVNGIVESSEEKGVPDFWLTAMKNNEITGREIYAHDEGALKFLKDIKLSMIDDPKGFKLEFIFDTNPYFKNSVLTKTYQLIDEDDPILKKPIGMEIEWHRGKCLTQKNVRKNSKKGSNMRIPKTVQCESFFNFFSPPVVSYNDEEDPVKALHLLMAEDYYVGHAIKDKIIPHTVSWFTGDAIKDFVEYDDHEDDEDTDSEEKYHLNNKKKSGRAAAGVGPRGKRSLGSRTENKLQDPTGKHSYIFDRLSPLVRKRIEVLREFQCEHDELEAQFFEETAALETKYQELYQPLYTKRYEIVNGVVEEVEETVIHTAKEHEGEESSESEEKGVPYFWRTAMGYNMFTGREIYKNDEEPLKFLKDIKWSRIDDPKGFKLEFIFNTNPYFKNSVLTKTYHFNDEDDPILKKPIGTKIEWHTGICLNEEIVRMKPEEGSYTRPSKTVRCKSFFDFFSPPEVVLEDDEDAVEELQNLMKRDINIGLTIKDKIIPHAVSWFTGDALKGLVESEDEDDDEDTYSEEEEEE